MSTAPPIAPSAARSGLTMLRAAREFARHAEVPCAGVRFDIVNIVFSYVRQR